MTPLIAVFSPATSYRPITLMWADLTAALREAGFMALSHETREGPDMFNDMQLVLHELISWPGPKAVISSNGGFLPQIAGPDGKPVNFTEQYDIPVWTLMIDEPTRHRSRLQKASQRSVVSYIDANHQSFIKDGDMERKGSVFFPHGSPVSMPKVIPSSRREEGLLFIGDVRMPPTPEAWVEESLEDETLQGIVFKVLEKALDPSNMQYSYMILKEQLEGAGLALDMEGMGALTAAIEEYVHMWTRFKTLSSIKRHSVDIFGSVEAAAQPHLTQHRLHGPISFMRGLVLMSQARFLLNPVRIFRAATHERIGYGLSHGCIPLATPSRLLSGQGNAAPLSLDILGDGNDDDRIDEYLGMGKSADDFQAAAMERNDAEHSWRVRVEKVREIIDLLHG